MLIACPTCSTSYEIAPSSLGRAGRSVRCVRCQQVWFATNPGVLSAVAEAYREEVGAPSPPLPPGSDEPIPPPGDRSSGTEPPATVAEPPTLATSELSSTEQDIAAEPARTDAPADEPPAASDAAVPSTVADAPALVPEHPDQQADLGATTTTTNTAADVESIAARRHPHRTSKRRRRTLPFGWAAVILSLLALNAGLIAWRAEVVRWLPQTAALYSAVGLAVNLRGLAFAEVATETETQDGVAVLVIGGTIVSTTGHASEVPRLRFAVRNDRGQEIYSWTAQPPKNMLAPRASVAFRSRLASPPPEAHEVLVRFDHRRDTSAQVP
jgi:predicted Zn finger-like uncharacterized protein